MQDILIIGCGNMGQAILKGWLSFSHNRIIVVDPNRLNREKAQALGAETFLDVATLSESYSGKFELVLVAVKPQVLSSVLPEYRVFLNQDTVILSIAAGIGLKQLQKALPNQINIIRCMPNMPASVSEGVMACVGNEHLCREKQASITSLLETNGCVVWLDNESEIDAVTAISGSGPAYFYLMTEYLAIAGVSLGLTSKLSEKLARATFVGSSALLKSDNAESPKQLRISVTSPGGTTEAGLAILMSEETGLLKLLNATVKSAKDRATDLSRTDDS